MKVNFPNLSIGIRNMFCFVFKQDATVGLSFDGITKNLAEALMILIDELYKKQQMPRETKKKRQKKQNS